MSNESRTQRWRLLLIAGVVAPGLMAAIGWMLPVFLRLPPPTLRGAVTPGLVFAGLTAAGCSLGCVALLYRLHPALGRALRHSGERVGLDALELAGYPIMLVVVSASALGEEVLFRGGLQPIIGLIPSALLFGLSHGGWRREMWAYVLAAALSGTIFGVALRLTGSLWVPVLAHAVHNVISTLLMGKKVDLTWEGWLPRVRLLPDPLDADDEGETDGVDEPVSAAPDGPEPGPADGDPPDREPE